jgi:hypothetical protein
MANLYALPAAVPTKEKKEMMIATTEENGGNELPTSPTYGNDAAGRDITAKLRPRPRAVSRN